MGAQERRQREKESRKNQILGAARTLLIEKGIQGASIHQIARRAELGVATIYFYYQNKEAVYAALQEEGLELLYQKIRQAARRAASPPEKIRRMSRAYYRFSETHRDYFDIINYFLSQPGIIFTPKVKNQVDFRGNKILALVEEVIDQGLKQGLFEKSETRKSSILLWGTLHGLMQFKKMKETLLQGEKYKELFQYAVERFIRGLQVSSPVKEKNPYASVRNFKVLEKSKGGQGNG
jgi:AcrR family transcriptional regulator